MPLVEQRGSVGIAEVELIVEVHPVEHHALGEGVRKLQRKTLRHAALQLHEERVVMVLPGADQFVDLAEVGVDAAFGEQTVVHVRQGDRRPTAGRCSCAREDRRCTSSCLATVSGSSHRRCRKADARRDSTWCRWSELCSRKSRAQSANSPAKYRAPGTAEKPGKCPEKPRTGGNSAGRIFGNVGTCWFGGPAV